MTDPADAQPVLDDVRALLDSLPTASVTWTDEPVPPGDRLERFSTMTSIYNDDPDLLRYAELIVAETWDYAVEDAGGRSAGPPDSIALEPNLHYGVAYQDEDGDPVLDDRGEPVIDEIKVYAIARGWAYRDGPSVPANRPANPNPQEAQPCGVYSPPCSPLLP